MTFRLSLPWPPLSLHPNGRAHWRDKARAAKTARADARLIAQAMGCRALGWAGARVTVTFHPPHNRRRDTDGALAACKSIFDGIADATGIDDHLWTIGAPVMSSVKPGGEVIVEFAKP